MTIIFRENILRDIRESGGHTKMLISLFITFSVLSTVRLAEIAVFSKILRKNKFLKFQKNDIYKK